MIKALQEFFSAFKPFTTEEEVANECSDFYTQKSVLQFDTEKRLKALLENGTKPVDEVRNAAAE